MMELFACRLNRDDKPLGKSELIAAVGDSDVLVPTVDDRIDGEVLAAGGTLLKLMASADFDIFKHEPALDFRPQATDNVVLLPLMG